MKKKTKRIRRVRCCGNCKYFLYGWKTGEYCTNYEIDVEWDVVCDYHKPEPKEIK